MHASNSSTVELVTVAAEIGISADELAQRFGDAVVEDAAGIRCVATDRARAFLADHRRTKAQRERAERQQAEFAAKRDAEHRRLLRRIRALPPAQDGVPALALALARDPDSRLARSSRRLDEMLAAQVFTTHQGRGDATMTLSFRLIGPPLPRWQRTHKASPEPAEPMRLLELCTRAELAIERIDRLRAARAPPPVPGMRTRHTRRALLPRMRVVYQRQVQRRRRPEVSACARRNTSGAATPSAQPRIAHLQADVRLP